MTSTKKTPQTRPKAPGAAAGEDIARMIRVDHAGEMGAVRIYQGQLAVLGARKSKAASAIRRMEAEEQRHLAAFDVLIHQRRVRPTALEPVWRLAGFALGAATALMGEKAAMACTVAVEEVIDRHYAEQIALLGAREPALKKTVSDFRAEEIAHRDEALAHGAEQAPAYRLLSETIKAGCRLAIGLSTRI